MTLFSEIPNKFYSKLTQFFDEICVSTDLGQLKKKVEKYILTEQMISIYEESPSVIQREIYETIAAQTSAFYLLRPLWCTINKVRVKDCNDGNNTKKDKLMWYFGERERLAPMWHHVWQEQKWRHTRLSLHECELSVLLRMPKIIALALPARQIFSHWPTMSLTHDRRVKSRFSNLSKILNTNK